MGYITVAWLDDILKLETEQELLDALAVSPRIAESILVAMQIARNKGKLGKIEGLGNLPFEPAHCWNEFCEDPDAIVPRERDDLSQIMGPKIESMIREAHKAEGRPDADALSARIATFLDHPVIDLRDSCYTHPLDEGYDRIFIELDGYAPRAYVANGVDPWQPLIEDQQPEPEL